MSAEDDILDVVVIGIMQHLYSEHVTVELKMDSILFDHPHYGNTEKLHNATLLYGRAAMLYREMHFREVRLTLPTTQF